MRRAELALLALLFASPALAHALHVVRGELSREPEALVLTIETGGAHPEPKRCLRMLDELDLRDARGVRLIGIERDAEREKACELAYVTAGHEGPLTLGLHPKKRGPRRNERLVIARAEGEPIVVSNRGGLATLDLEH